MGPADKMTLDAADWWINKAFTYGLAFVFTAGVLGLLLWVAFVIVSLVRRYLPLWVESQIESHKKVCERIDRLCDTVECVHENGHAVRTGAIHATKGLRSHLNANKERLGIKSDVLIHMDNASEALEKRPPPHEHPK